MIERSWGASGDGAGNGSNGAASSTHSAPAIAVKLETTHERPQQPTAHELNAARLPQRHVAVSAFTGTKEIVRVSRNTTRE